MKQQPAQRGMDLVVTISRIVVGGLFSFSGFVKAVDPLGTAYKIEDYLIEMGLSLLLPLTVALALVMVVAEFTLGMMLLLGVWRKWSLRLIALFLLFFTPLALWIALAEPVEDCGCFGDAIHISNWETFYKNLVLSAAVVLLLVQRERITPLFRRRTEAAAAALFILFFGVLFALHNLYRLPLFDFRPYRIGASIPQQMQADPAKADVYETFFIYQKDGKKKEFPEEDFPWNDSTWTFVEMQTRLVKEGVKPPIEDLVVTGLSPDEESGSLTADRDITDTILMEPSWQFLMIATSLEEMNERHLERFMAMQRFAAERGYPFYLLTASSPEKVAAWEEQHHSGFRFAGADEKVLKTMIRSNPGLMLLREGVVINKWDDSRVPSPIPDGIAPEASKLIRPMDPQVRSVTDLSVVSLLLFLPLLFLKWLERGRSVRTWPWRTGYHREDETSIKK